MHAHACIRFERQVNLRKNTTLLFMDAFAVPATSTDSKRRRNGDFDMKGGQGFFYCGCKKISTVVQGGNYHPFKHYLVNPDWAMTLWQQRKIAPATARAIIVQCKKTCLTCS